MRTNQVIISLILLGAQLALGKDLQAQKIPTAKTIETAILGSLEAQGHWFTSAKASNKFTHDKNSGMSADGLSYQGSTRLQWGKLPGGASIHEAYTYTLRKSPEAVWTLLDKDLVQTESWVSELKAPSKHEVLLMLYKVLRNPEQVSQLISHADTIVAFTYVDAMTKAESSFENAKAAVDLGNVKKPVFTYEIDVEILLEYEYLVPRNQEKSSWELFKRRSSSLLSLRKVDNSNWGLIVKELLPSNNGVVETSVSQAALPARAPEVFGTLTSLGFDLIWGKQDRYQTGLQLQGKE